MYYNRLLIPTDSVLLQDLPFYYEVIKKPIDLDTISTKLENGEYSSVKGLERDLLLMIQVREDTQFLVKRLLP